MPRSVQPAAAVTLVVLLVLAMIPARVLAQGQSLLSMEVTGSPLVVAAEGAPVEAAITLAEPAELRVRVTDFDGRTVQELFAGTRDAGTVRRTWRGRDRDGDRVPPGPYRIVATASASGRTERAAEWVTVADRKVYPQRPGFITVAVDPGHGGRLDGAVGADGTREADINLDIALRLARMLEAAGVKVALTRSTDAFVNTPEEDRTSDGVIDDDDELAARPDVANEARADLFVAVHNNIAVNESVGGPSTYYFDERPFGSRSERLARLVQEEMLAALRGIGPDGYEPYDHGTLIYPYYVLRDYDPPRLRRPTQMPGVLSEGMFLSNARELRLLKRPAVRGAMAAAYYRAIARYLAGRRSHVGYELLSAPPEPVAAGEPVPLVVEVRNHGTEDMRGWKLVVGSLPRSSRYIGRSRAGTTVGTARLPRLAPGERAQVELEVTAPDAAGEWMLLFDARDRDGGRASRDGSPRLQVPLDTLAPPEPSPSPFPDAAATPSGG